MDVDQILKALEHDGGVFPKQAIEAAIERREEITPHLLQILEDAIARAESPYEDSGAHLYALYLLAQFREKRAYPLVVAICRLDEHTMDRFIGDVITEGLSRILASVCHGDTAPIEALIEDPAVYGYARGAALNSLIELVSEGAKSRDEVMAYFKTLFDGKLERSQSQIWNSLAYAATELHPAEVYDDIRKAYDDELVEPFFMAWRYVEEAFGKEQSAVLNQLSANNLGYITDTIAEMENWAYYRESAQSSDSPLVPPVAYSNPPIHDAKVGPNEPCPCGSGKKYKKCCGKVV